jgi:signal transduction histidine kinase
MRPYSDDENGGLADRMPADGAPGPEHISVRRGPGQLASGGRLRGGAIARAAKRCWAWVVRLAGRSQGPETTDYPQSSDLFSEIASELKTPLASIRSSAEILRDNPNLALEQRNQFLDVVLAEDERLDLLITRILDASDISRSRGIWRVSTRKLAKHLGDRAA